MASFTVDTTTLAEIQIDVGDYISALSSIVGCEVSRLDMLSAILSAYMKDPGKSSIDGEKVLPLLTDPVEKQTRQRISYLLRVTTQLGLLKIKVGSRRTGYTYTLCLPEYSSILEQHEQLLSSQAQKEEVILHNSFDSLNQVKFAPHLKMYFEIFDRCVRTSSNEKLPPNYQVVFGFDSGEYKNRKFVVHVEAPKSNDVMTAKDLRIARSITSHIVEKAKQLSPEELRGLQNNFVFDIVDIAKLAEYKQPSSESAVQSIKSSLLRMWQTGFRFHYKDDLFNADPEGSEVWYRFLSDVQFTKMETRKGVRERAVNLSFSNLLFRQIIEERNFDSAPASVLAEDGLYVLFYNAFRRILPEFGRRTHFSLEDIISNITSNQARKEGLFECFLKLIKKETGSILVSDRSIAFNWHDYNVTVKRLDDVVKVTLLRQDYGGARSEGQTKYAKAIPLAE